MLLLAGVYKLYRNRKLYTSRGCCRHPSTGEPHTLVSNMLGVSAVAVVAVLAISLYVVVATSHDGIFTGQRYQQINATAGRIENTDNYPDSVEDSSNIEWANSFIAPWLAYDALLLVLVLVGVLVVFAYLAVPKKTHRQALAQLAEPRANKVGISQKRECREGCKSSVVVAERQGFGLAGEVFCGPGQNERAPPGKCDCAVSAVYCPVWAGYPQGVCVCVCSVASLNRLSSSPHVSRCSATHIGGD